MSKFKVTKRTDDTLISDNDFDQIIGGRGDDTIVASDGDDIISAGSGDDTVYAGEGDDLIIGGSGDDTIYAGDGNDTIIAGSGNDYVDGGAGDDFIIGGSGDDTLLGGSGNDYIHGGSGDDYIDGGEGVDTLVGGEGNDTIMGSADSDLILGGSGHDYLEGGDGDDLITGNDGNDTVLGGAGNDNITGAQGDDVLDGGSGSDVVKGGSGNDRLIFTASLQNVGDINSYYGNHGVDTLVLNLTSEELANAKPEIMEYLNNGDPLSSFTFQSLNLTVEGFEYLEIFVINSGPASQDQVITIDEDSAYTFDLSNFVFDDTGDFEPDQLAKIIINPLSDGSGGVLKFNGVNVASQIEINPADVGLLTFEPAENDNGDNYASFSFQLQDDGGTELGGSDLSDHYTISFNLTPVNDNPIANDDALSVDEDTPLIISASQLLQNDTDIDLDVLSVLSISQPVHGVLSDNGDGTYTYMPNENYNGEDSFTYAVTDGNGGTSSAVVGIIINAVNDAAVIEGDVNKTVVETDDVLSVSGVLTASDVDNEDNLFIAQSAVQGNYGVFDLDANGHWNYVSNESFDELNNGDSLVDNFIIESIDGTQQEVKITIKGSNDAPTIAGLVASRNFSENAINLAAQLIDSDIELSDIDSQNFDGGFVKVSYASGGSAADQLNIKPVSDGVGIFNAVISYAGVQIGSLVSNGANGADLEIALNANATVQSVEALIESINYGNISNDPVVERVLRLTVNDGDGGTSLAHDIAVTINPEEEPENTYMLGTGNETVAGGDADDTFVIAASNLSSGDVIDAGAGIDTLVFNGHADITIDQLTNLFGIDVIQFNGSSIQVSDTFIANSDIGVVTLNNQTNELFVDVSAVTNPENKVYIGGTGTVYMTQPGTLYSADGVDTNIWGSNLDDTFYLGSGSNSIVAAEGDDLFYWRPGAAGSADRLFANGGSDTLIMMLSPDYSVTGLRGLIDANNGDYAKGTFTVNGESNTLEISEFENIQVKVAGNVNEIDEDAIISTTVDQLITNLANITDSAGPFYARIIELPENVAVMVNGEAKAVGDVVEVNGDELLVTPETNYSVNSAALKFEIFQVENNEEVVYVNDYSLPLTINAVADPPILEVLDTATPEDKPVLLPITALLQDADGSETLSIEILGVPFQASLSAGTKDEFGVWRLTPDDLYGLMFTPAENSDENLTLIVKAISTESSSGVTAEVTQNLNVIVNPVADAPIFNVGEIPPFIYSRIEYNGKGDVVHKVTPADTEVQIPISVQAVDPEEKLTVEINNVPEGIVFTDFSAQDEYLTDLGGTFFMAVFAAELIKYFKDSNDPTTSGYSSVDPFAADKTGKLEIIQTMLETMQSFGIIDNNVNLTLVIEAVASRFIGQYHGNGRWTFDGNELDKLAYMIPYDDPFVAYRSVPANISQWTFSARSTETGDYADSTIVVKEGGTIDLSQSSHAKDNVKPQNNFDLQFSDIRNDNEIDITGISVSDIDELHTSISRQTFKIDTVKLSVENGSINIANVAGGAIEATIIDGANNTSTLTLAGTQEQINTALETITYKANGSLYDNDTLRIITTDKEGLTDEHVISLGFTAPPNPPALFFNVPSGFEDTAISLEILGVPDKDDGSETLTYKVIELPEGAVLSAGTQNVDGSWTLSESDLTDLTITPAADSDEDFSIVLQVTSTNGAGAFVTVETSIDVSVIAATDTPTLTIVASAVGDEDTEIPLTISGQLTDTDGSETLSFTISDVPDGATFTDGNNNAVGVNIGAGKWVFSSEEMPNLHVKLDKHHNEDFVVKVAATASEANNEESTDIGTYVVQPVTTAEQSIGVTVNAVNDNPVNNIEKTDFFGNEVTAINIDGISVDDPDEIDTVDADKIDSAKLTVLHGSLRVDLSDGASISAGANDSHTLTVIGTQTQINAALATLQYTGDIDFNGMDILTIQSTDKEGASDSSAIAININDTPENTVPIALQNVYEDGGLVFSSDNGNQLSVSDSDDVSQTVTLTATNGTVLLANTSGLAFHDGTNNGGATLKLSGSIADINQALDGLRFNPDENFNGSAVLQITTVDSHGAQASDSVLINVVSVNDAPAGTDNTITIDEDTPYTFNASDFGFTDPDDADADNLSNIIITDISNNGSLVLNDAAVNDGDNISIADIVNGNLKFNPALNENGSNYAGFNFQVQDDGGVDNNGADTDQTPNAIVINVNPVNDAAIISGVTTSAGQEAGGLNNSVTGINEVSGALSSVDVDNNDNVFIAEYGLSDSGYGIFFINSAGHWSYAFDENNSVIQALNVGDTLTDTFTVRSEDGTEQQISIIINGANDTAVITGTFNHVVSETNAPLSLSGELIVNDLDNPNTFVQQHIVGAHGTFDINTTGAWHYVASSALDSLNVGDSVTEKFTVSSADGTTQDVTITINGSNDVAVITGDFAQSAIETHAVLTLNGALVSNDPDNENTFIQQANVAGENGTFNIDVNGNWSYQANSTFDHLNVGESVFDHFTVSSVDGTTQQVVVTINGSNDAAVISGAISGSVAEASGLNNAVAGVPTATGALFADDVDNNNNVFIAASGHGDLGYGTFTMSSSGVWNYTLDNNNAQVQALNVGDTLNDRFTVRSEDGTEQQVSIIISGGDDAPVITGDFSQSATETNDPLVLNGKLSVNDPDDNNQFIAQNFSGNNGVLTIDVDGNWTYQANSAFNQLNVGQSVSDNFTVSTSGGSTQEISVTINGVNDPTFITGDISKTVVETDEALSVSGKLVATDLDNLTGFNQQNFIGAHGALSINADGNWVYVANGPFNELNIGAVVVDSFIVSAIDGATQQVAITIVGSNDAAVISGTTSGVVAEASGLNNAVVGAPTASGKIVADDIDNNNNVFIATSVESDSGYGAFSITSDGAWSYTLNNNHAAVQALNIDDVLTDTFSVQSEDGTTQEIAITIHGGNDTAVIAGDLNKVAVETDEPLSIDGVLTVSDFDDPSSFVEQLDVSGSHGIFSVDKSGHWHYTASSAFDELNFGDSVVDQFTVSAVDGATEVVTITIEGSNDAAVISGTVTGEVIEASGDGSVSPGTPIASGALASLDPDNSDNVFQAASGDTAYGSYTMTTEGLWTYTLDNDNATIQAADLNIPIVDTFTVLSEDGTEQVVSITIQPVNDAPESEDRTITISENNGYLFSVDDFKFTDVEGHELLNIIFNAQTIHGTLKLNGEVVDISNAPKVISAQDIPNLYYKPAAGDNGYAYDSISFQVQDNGGVANGGIDIDQSANKLLFNIIPDKNTAPTASDNAIFVSRDSGYHQFAATDFNFNDSDGNFLKTVIIEALPTEGVLLLDGVAIAIGDKIPANQLQNLIYTATSDINLLSDSFTFKVQDDAGINNGGNDTSELAYTINLAVRPFPAGEDKIITIDEDSSHTFINIAEFGLDPAEANSAVIIIKSLPTNGNLTLKVDGNADNDVLLAVGDNINADDIGKLVYSPNANVNGDALDSFIFQVKTDGGVALSTNTITFNITPQVDLPEGTDGVIQILEDNDYQFAISDFGFRDGDGDTFAKLNIESLPQNGTLYFNDVVISSGDLPKEILSTDIGNLVYKPIADDFGDYSFQFSVVSSSNEISTSVNTLSLHVRSVNDIPVLTNAVSDFTVNANDSMFLFSSDVVLSDVDSANFDGGVVRITYASGRDISDQLNIQSVQGGIDVVDSLVFYEGVQVGVVVSNGDNGNDLNISLNENASIEYVNALIQAISYTNTSRDPVNNKILSVEINDGDNDISLHHEVTVAVSVPPDQASYILTDGADTIMTGKNSHEFIVPSDTALSSEDVIDAGLGYDVLNFGSSSVNITIDQLANVSGIDGIQFNADSAARLSNDFVAASDSGIVMLHNQSYALNVDLSKVNDPANKVFVSGTGQVTMTDSDGSNDGILSGGRLYTESGVNTHIVGSNFDDGIILNQGDHTVNAGGGDDTVNIVIANKIFDVSGNISGGDGNDTLILHMTQSVADYWGFNAIPVKEIIKTYSDNTAFNAYEFENYEVRIVGDKASSGNVATQENEVVYINRDFFVSQYQETKTPAEDIFNQGSFYFVLNDYDNGAVILDKDGVETAISAGQRVEFEEGVYPLLKFVHQQDIINGDMGFGNALISYTIEDEYGLPISNNHVVFNIFAVNHAPTILNQLVDQSVSEDAYFSYTFDSNTFNDVDINDQLSYTATLSDGSALPSWLSFDNVTRTFSGTPLDEDVGTITVSVSASDGELSVNDTFDITVTNVNDYAAVFGGDLNKIATETNSPLTISGVLTSQDFDNPDNLFTPTSSLGAYGTFDLQVNGAWTYTANSAFNELSEGETLTDSISVQSIDGTKENVVINIVGANDPLSISVPNTQSIDKDVKAYILGTDENTIKITDPDANDHIQVTLTVANGILSVTPQGNAVISDGLNNSSSLTVYGLQQDVNDTLASLAYQGDAGFTGNDSLTIFAEDAGDVPFTLTETIEINVVESNQLPAVKLNNPVLNIEENTDVSSNIKVADIEIINDINGGGTLSLLGADAANFEIVGTELYLKAGVALDFETAPIFNVSVAVDDPALGGTPDGLATLKLNITNVNEAPTLTHSIPDQDASEGDAFSYQIAAAAFNDVDAGDSLSYSATLADGTALPDWLNFDTNSRTFSGTPTNDDVGTISVKVIATDEGNLSVSDTFNLVVNNTNDAPNAINSAVSVSEDGEVILTASDFNYTDIDQNDALASVVIKSLPANGDLLKLDEFGNYVAVSVGDVFTKAELDNASLKFIPAANDDTDELFSFSVKDTADAESDVATMLLRILPINDAPLAVNNIVVTNEDIAYVFTLGDFNFSDVDTGDLLSKVQITSLGSAGSLEYNNNGVWEAVITNQEITASAIAAGNLRFAPAANENGDAYASFNFKVNDGSVYSENDNTIVVNVASVSDAPTAANNTIVIDEDTSHVFTAADFNFSDVDSGNVLTKVQITSLESAGALEFNNGGTWEAVVANEEVTVADINAGNLRFVPNANENGAAYASFGFKVSDGTLYSENAYTLTLDVTPIPDAPVIEGLPNSIDFLENTVNAAPQILIPNNITLTDIDGADFSGGSLTVDTYIDTDENDLLNIQNQGVGLGQIAVSGATVSFEGNDFATIVGDGQNGNELIINFDNSGNATVAAITALINALTYQNISDDPVDESRTLFLTLEDSDGASQNYGIDLYVAPENDAPTAVNDSVTMPEDGGLNIFVLDNDIDPDAFELSIIEVAGQQHGTASIFNNFGLIGINYTPDANYNGVDSFTYTVSDGELTDQGTVTVTILPQNDAPTVQNAILDQVALEDIFFSYQVPENTFVDIDGDALSYSATLADGSVLPSWLSFAEATKTFSGTPDNDQVGAVSVKVVANDGEFTAEDTFNITVNNVNDAPTSQGNAIDVVEDVAKVITTDNFVFNDIDVGDALEKVIITELPLVGVLKLDGVVVSTAPSEVTKAALDAGQLSYQPALNSVDDQSFKFKVHDGDAESAEYTFNLLLQAVNDAPTVTLANMVTSLEENLDTSTRIKLADIIVSDDELGSHNLSLIGSDAEKFEIDGAELFLKAGIALDFETQESLSVSVAVDDPSISGTPDNTAAFTLNVIDVFDDIYIETLTSGDDVFVTDALNDTFIVNNAADFSASDVIDARGEVVDFANKDYGDVIVFNASITIDAADLANKTSIEAMEFNADGNALTLDQTFINSSGGGLVIKNGTHDIHINSNGVTGDLLIDGNGAITLEGQLNGAVYIAQGVDANVTGGNGDDHIVGNDGDDTLVGGYGGDIIEGGAGNDIIYADEKPFSADTIAGLGLWFDAADIYGDGSRLADGATVASFKDKSGNNRDGVAADGASIIYDATAINGSAGLTFGGDFDFFSVDLSFMADSDANNPTNRYSIFAVESHNAKVNNYFLGHTDPNYGVDTTLFHGYQGDTAFKSVQFGNINDNITVSAGADGVGNISSFILDDADRHTRYYDASSPDVLTGVGTGDTQGLVSSNEGAIGRTFPTSRSGYYYDGDIGEILIFDRAVTDEERDTIEQYLSLKWGQSINEFTVGQDVLTGGLGSDTFVWGNPSFSYPTAPDVVTDFVINEDVIDISTLIDGANFNVLGNDSFNGLTNQIIWRQGTGDDSVNMFIDIDYDGDNAADFSIKLENVAASEFSGNDIIVGSATGTTGDDTLRGGDGDDTLVGGYGGDTIEGGAGNDIIYADEKPFSADTIAGLGLWFDAADIYGDGSGLADGATVTSFKDKSGNNRDGVAADGASIIYDATAINGSAGLTFGGDFDFFSVDLSFMADSDANNPTNRYSIFAVESHNAKANSYFLGQTDPTYGADTTLFHGYQSDTSFKSVQWGNVNDNITVSASADGVANISSFILNDVDRYTRYYDASSPNVLTAAGTGDTQGLVSSDGGAIGRTYPTSKAGYYYDGDIGEILIFDRAVTDAERNTIEQYLSLKWGQPINEFTLGQDVLTGGLGSDTFVWGNPSFSYPSAPDRITDFNSGSGSYKPFEGDKIDIENLTNGDFYVKGLDAALVNGGGLNQLAWHQVGNDTEVQLDFNGDGVADWAIVLQDFEASNLREADFILGPDSDGDGIRDAQDYYPNDPALAANYVEVYEAVVGEVQLDQYTTELIYDTFTRTVKYDPRGDIHSIEIVDEDIQAVVDSASYNYDSLGRLINISQDVDSDFDGTYDESISTDYQYNTDGLLSRVLYEDGDGVTQTQYAYDANGQLTAKYELSMDKYGDFSNGSGYYQTTSLNTVNLNTYDVNDNLAESSYSQVATPSANGLNNYVFDYELQEGQDFIDLFDLQNPGDASFTDTYNLTWTDGLLTLVEVDSSFDARLEITYKAGTDLIDNMTRYEEAIDITYDQQGNAVYTSLGFKKSMEVFDTVYNADGQLESGVLNETGYDSIFSNGEWVLDYNSPYVARTMTIENTYNQYGDITSNKVTEELNPGSSYINKYITEIISSYDTQGDLDGINKLWQEWSYYNGSWSLDYQETTSVADVAVNGSRNLVDYDHQVNHSYVQLDASNDASSWDVKDLINIQDDLLLNL